MPVAPAEHPIRAHIVREALGPGSPHVLALRAPTALLAHYSRIAAALGVDRAVLLRMVLLAWLESPDGGGLPPGTGLTPP